MSDHREKQINLTSSKLKTCASKNTIRGFPVGPVVKNPPSNAGDVGFIPGRGTKIPHTAGQLSPHATTTELARLNERAHVPWSLRATTKTQHSQNSKGKEQKQKYKLIFKEHHQKIEKKKKNPTEWEKYLQIVSNKGLVSRMYKELSQLNF